mgnify:CR=1 FL=1
MDAWKAVSVPRGDDLQARARASPPRPHSPACPFWPSPARPALTSSSRALPQAELVKRKLLSQDELEVRRSRRALAAKAREEAKKAAKPRQARLAARKMTNTHLDIN